MTTSAVRTARYMTRFRCLGGECEDTCCGGWQVPVDEPTHRRLTVLAEHEPAARKLVSEGIELTPQGPDFARLRFQESGHCGMLESDGLCAIHARLGAEALPDVCLTYPRYFNEVDGQLELFGTVSCPEVARLCLLSEDAHGLEAMETDTPRKLRNRFRTDQPYYQPFLLVREGLTTLLDEPGQSLEAKLFALLWFSNQLEPVLHAKASAVPSQDLKAALAALNKPEVVAALAHNYRGLHVDGSFALSVLARALGTSEPSDVQLAALWSEHQVLREQAPAAAQQRLEQCLTRYAINHLFTTPYMLFENLLAFAQDLVVRIAALRFQLVPALARFTGSAPELDRLIVDVVYKFGRRVEHSALMPKLHQLLEQQGMRTFAHAVCFVAV